MYVCVCGWVGVDKICSGELAAEEHGFVVNVTLVYFYFTVCV